MASYKGGATISGIQFRPPGIHPKHYFDPLEEWLKDFTIPVGGRRTSPGTRPRLANRR